MIYTLLINTVAVYLTAKLLDGVEIKSFFSALVVAVLLALVNTFIKPVIVFLTLPITILTLGLFIFVINALMLMLVDAISDGLKIRSFGWALIFSIVLSIINGLLFWIF
ncbi:phage holin family protein [Aliifodinibius sp. S!AR15-10]|uniref:phage holin family protein n=1 Tax=Aliifodinibius sp. S!AR15-10 TaxID=2950437 RepID=UPI00286194D9|nr:phage holin family protein [Aliifodinibius sp. S!AR15-10]MDR8391903.1 phage holin family protein [Aliifodinibius sp. S!AR15-10]